MQEEDRPRDLHTPQTSDPNGSHPPRPPTGTRFLRHTRIPRRRAVKACLPCRHRKVRCDVSVHGSPCTNCLYDEKPCVVADRASRRRLPSSADADLELGFDYEQPAMTGEAIDMDTPADVTSPDHQIQQLLTALDKPYSPVVMDEDIGYAQDSEELEAPLESSAPQPVPAEATVSPSRLSREDEPTTDQASPELPLEVFLMEPKPTQADFACDAPGPWGPSPGCAFLDSDGLAVLPQPDIVFLQAKGCFHIPSRPILDEFMREYFLHVHPFLPMLDEGDFWAAYQQETPDKGTPKITLLVFQAMLFASSNFVPLNVVRALGFRNIQAARLAFYHRAKALFDVGPEAPPDVAARAALLLTFWCPPPIRRPSRANSMWLSLAVYHARCAKAHLAWDLDPSSHAPDAPHEQDLHATRMLKRLWWCCIIRDRFLSLGMRRSLHIPTTYPILAPADFQAEVVRSEVHSSETKRRLVHTFTQLMHLCNILTDLLSVASVTDSAIGMDKELIKKLNGCRASLQSWYKKQLQPSPGNPPSGIRQRSVIVHTNLMHIFYFASRIALSHREMLLTCPQIDVPPNAMAVTRESFRGEEVREACLGTTACLQELLQLDLIRYLPLGAVAFSMTPFLLHTLDFTMRPRHSRSTDALVKQDRLKVLVDAMKTYRTFYDGIDWISQAVRKAASFARVDRPSAEQSGASGWIDICFQHPALYLRLALTIDMAMCEERVPNEGEIVALLQVHWVSGKAIPRLPSSGTARYLPAPTAPRHQGPSSPKPGDLKSSETVLGLLELGPQKLCRDNDALADDDGTTGSCDGRNGTIGSTESAEEMKFDDEFFGITTQDWDDETAWPETWATDDNCFLYSSAEATDLPDLGPDFTIQPDLDRSLATMV